MKNHEGRVIMLELRNLNNAAKLLALKKQAKSYITAVRKHLLNREYHIESFFMNNNVNSLTKAANSLDKAKNAKNAAVKAAKNAAVIAQKIGTVMAAKTAAKTLVYSRKALEQLNKAFVTYPNAIKRKGRFVFTNA